MKTPWTPALLALTLVSSAASAHGVAVRTVTVMVPAAQTVLVVPSYPVVVREAKLADTFKDDSDASIYEQEFLPRSLVRLKTDLTVPYYHPLKGSEDTEPTIIKAGSVFVEANIQGEKVYCTAIAQAKRNMILANIDLGICLSDPQHAGTFTRMISFASFLPERDAYDVKHVVGLGAKTPAVTDTHIDYEDVPVDDTYASKIEVRVVGHALFAPCQWAPVLDIAPKLRRDGLQDSAHGGRISGFENVIAAARFLDGKFYHSQWWDNYCPRADKPLSFGTAISVNFEKQNDGLWKLGFDKTLAPGVYNLHFAYGDGLFTFDPWPTAPLSPIQ